MDRVIKFRGKDICGKWRFGDLIHYRSCITISETKGGLYSNSEVIPETVGQFTGFKDMYDKEIYEGDIIQNDKYPEFIYYVEMMDGCWSTVDEVDYKNLDWTLRHGPHKVIGNVHDNPELLEVQHGEV